LPQDHFHRCSHVEEKNCEELASSTSDATKPTAPADCRTVTVLSPCWAERLGWKKYRMAVVRCMPGGSELVIVLFANWRRSDQSMRKAGAGCGQGNEADHPPLARIFQCVAFVAFQRQPGQQSEAT